MILYNVTIIIEEAINQEWLTLMNNQIIPAAMQTNLVASNRLLKVVDSPNEGITYCLQFVVDNIGAYHQFGPDFASRIMKDHDQIFKNRFVTFSTLMEFVD